MVWPMNWKGEAIGGNGRTQMTAGQRDQYPGKRRLLQLRVLDFGLLVDGDVGVGVFPEGEEILVSGERSDSGGVGIGPLRSSRLQRIGTRNTQMSQGSRPAVPHDAAVVDDLLKLGGCFLALSSCEVCLAANVGGIEAG